MIQRTFLIAAMLMAASAAFGQTDDVARKYFTDTPLVDQSGKTHRFYSDLMEGKVVVISSFYGESEGAGLHMSKTLGQVQELLSNRSDEINFISISVDPADTPVKSLAFAEKVNAGPGWYFLTGAKGDLDLVNKKLGLYVEERDKHLNLLLVGNTKTGLWKKVFALARPAEVKAEIEKVMDDKGEATGQ